MPPLARFNRTASALFLAIAMAATVGGALAFQHLGGYIPCKLCYTQRTPYYIGAPLMALAAIGSWLGWPSWISRALLAAGGALMLWGAYMGAYHSGVEWGFWPGPTDCGVVDGAPAGAGNGVLDSLNAVIPPSCDKAALRIFGLSLAGWNALIAIVLAAVAFRASAR